MAWKKYNAYYQGDTYHKWQPNLTKLQWISKGLDLLSALFMFTISAWNLTQKHCQAKLVHKGFQTMKNMQPSFLNEYS